LMASSTSATPPDRIRRRPGNVRSQSNVNGGEDGEDMTGVYASRGGECVDIRGSNSRLAGIRKLKMES
jgi:hypothetical protein